MDEMANTCADFVEPIKEDNGNKCILRHCENLKEIERLSSQANYWKTIFTQMLNGRRPEEAWGEYIKDHEKKIMELEQENKAIRAIKNYWCNLLAETIRMQKIKNGEEV
jgi:hypothetical protein